MKKEFLGKKICILGSSTDEHGWYMDFMRRFISTQQEKCYIINRSIGGNYCGLAEKMLEDEVFSCNPDIVFVRLGGNDVCVWRYDLKYENDKQMDEEIKKNDEIFYKKLREIILKIKERGIKVYIQSPNPHNEHIDENKKIESTFDNEDKARNLKATFYKKASLKKVNDKLKIYTEFEKNLAKELGVGFIDVFTPYYNKMLKDGCYHDNDGIHSNKKGHLVIARILLKALGYKNIPKDLYVKSDLCTVINSLEQIERSIQIFRRYKFYPIEEKPFKEINTDEDVINYVREKMKDTSWVWYAKAVVANEFFEKFYDIRKMILDLTLRV